jgi:hypothetical protein
MDPQGLIVQNAVVHYVPTSDDDSLLLTNDVIKLDKQLGDYFREKIVASQKRGLDVVIDPAGAQDVASAVASVLTGQDGLVPGSRRIATHLHRCQSGRNSPGLLAVLEGSIANKAVIGIVKLERERGVRYVLDEINGQQVVNLELLRNLTLTDKTKVFKTALLRCNSGQDAAAVTGRVSDDQRGTVEGLPVAHFFLSTFLGCQPRVKAAKATFDFVTSANDSFNTDVTSPEKRGRYQVALVAAMQSQTADIVPRTFANEHLEPLDRPAFLARVEKSGLAPDAAFPKDTSLVKIDRFKLTFDSGMVLVGDMEAFEQKVRVRDKGPVEVDDHISQLFIGK